MSDKKLDNSLYDENALTNERTNERYIIAFLSNQAHLRMSFASWDMKHTIMISSMIMEKQTIR